MSKIATIEYTMPRQPLIEFHGTHYHIIPKGNHREYAPGTAPTFSTPTDGQASIDPQNQQKTPLREIRRETKGAMQDAPMKTMPKPSTLPFNAAGSKEIKAKHD